MKRFDNLWPQVIAFDNLWQAWRKARRGKSRSANAVCFELELERNLLRLQSELQTGEYRPGRYRLFTIYERKPRLIAAAPFRDRVVHHALMNLIEPPLDRCFIHDSYACRKGKGVHMAVDRYQGWAQRYLYALKIDVQQYFPSIDHDILKEKLRRRIRDPEPVRAGRGPRVSMSPFPGLARRGAPNRIARDRLGAGPEVCRRPCFLKLS